MPLVEALSVDVPLVKADFDWINTAPSQGRHQLMEDRPADAAPSKGGHDVQLVEQSNATGVPDVGSQGDQCDRDHRHSCDHRDRLVPFEEDPPAWRRARPHQGDGEPNSS